MDTVPETAEPCLGRDQTGPGLRQQQHAGEDLSMLCRRERAQRSIVSQPVHRDVLGRSEGQGGGKGEGKVLLLLMMMMIDCVMPFPRLKLIGIY